MSFIKSMLKISSKHKKLNEELALASSIKDFTESPLDLNDEELTDDAVVYTLKFLGSTPLLQAKPEETKKTRFSKKPSLATTSAIKKVIAASKSQKKLTDVTISISPKGIDVFDTVTAEPVLEIPIYKISYCSVDAAHDTIFSFVSTTADKEENFEINQFGSPDSPIGQLESSSSLDDDNDLILHAFQCNKRKLAHTVTLSVARSFERAFQIYQSEQFLKEIREKKTNKENLVSNNTENIKNLIPTGDKNDEKCLIDLDDGPHMNFLYSKERNREFLQNTWVSFE
ncbi:low density lipoprotein receptor adapter protein 1-like isoform X2 [Chironomus tepperi]|uniref:low density lipoprotein receptor adapter protein 1-like isoform X2 n=1 Tax=Chironomus tepperi TaxID=113505 RepID=UPI00391F445D